jgi:hypothetical protein
MFTLLSWTCHKGRVIMPVVYTRSLVHFERQVKPHGWNLDQLASLEVVATK